MKQRQSVVLNKERKVEIESEPAPKSGANSILCRTVNSVISAGTELGKISGGFYWTNLPCLLGYSNVSFIEEVGPEVEDFRPGQRVFNQCSHSSYFTIETPSDSRFVPCVLPEEVSDEAATFVTHCAVAWYGVRKARLQPDEKVLIVGDGLVGLIAAQLVSHCGNPQVHIAGHHDLRLAKARDTEAVVFNSAQDDLRAFTDEVTDKQGFPVVINTAGVGASLLDAISACGQHGRIIQLGTISENVTLPTWEVERKEIAIVPAFQPLDPRDKQYHARKLMLELLKDGKLSVEGFITHRFDFQQAGKAYDILNNDRNTALGVVFTYE